MKRKMIMVLAAFLALLLVVGLFFLIKYIKETKQRAIELGYRRQNYAFAIIDYITFLNEYEKQYHDFESVCMPGQLYARIMLYNHDTGHTFSVEQIKEYLSKECEDDGSLRVSKNHPEIQDYIDFICYSAGYSETGDKIYPEEDPFESTFFYPFGRLKRFEIGLVFYAKDLLPEPYNHGH